MTLSYYSDNWIKVLRIQKSGIWIGIDSGEWVIEDQEGKIKLLSEVPSFTALPCLEIEKSIFEHDLMQALAEKHLPSNLLEKFPYEKIIITAFTLKSDYWISLALKWILKTNYDSSIVDALNSIKHEKRVSQKSRHQAQRIVNTWRKTSEKIS